MDGIGEFIASVRTYTSLPYLKKYGITLLAAGVLAGVLDKIVFPLYPVAADIRGSMAKMLTDLWPAGVAWFGVYGTLLEVLAVLGSVGSVGYVIWRKTAARRNQAAQNERLAANAEVMLVTMDPGDDSLPNVTANFFMAIRSAMACTPKQVFKGEAVHASVEIVSIGEKGKIGFLLWTPAALSEMFRMQLPSQFPEKCRLEVIADPLAVLGGQDVTAVELRLASDSLYPIRTEFGKDTEPLAGLINPLNPDADTVLAGIQFIFRPADVAWQQAGENAAQAMRQQIAMMEARMVGDATKAQLKALEAKKDQLGYEVTIRCFGAGADQGRVQRLVQAFGQYAGQNSFAIGQSVDADTIRKRAYPLHGKSPVLNVTEFSTVWHPPGKRIPSKSIVWMGAKIIAPPLGTLVSKDKRDRGQCRIVGSYKYPNGAVKHVGWRRDPRSGPGAYDATTHGYILGPTGSGKSTLLLNLIMDDIEHGCGVAVMEPHKDLTTQILQRIPPHRWADVIVLDATNKERPFGFNFLECFDPDERVSVASSMMQIFEKVSTTQWGVQMKEIMDSTLLALLEAVPNPTLYSVYHFMTDIDYRDSILVHVRDPLVRKYWDKWDEKKEDQQMREMAAPLRRLGEFLRSSLVRRITSQPRNTVNFRAALDNRKIILINLSATTLQQNAELMGTLFMSMFWRAASSRQDMPEENRVPFFFYVDEFQNYVTDTFATILAEARKFGLGLVLANQFAKQVESQSSLVWAAIKGNCGTKFCYRLSSPDDIRLMQDIFSGDVTARDLGTLPKFTLYTKLMSDKQTSETFTVAAPPPRGIVAYEEHQVVLKDANERSIPAKAEVPAHVVSLFKQIPTMSHDHKVAALTQMSSHDFHIFRELQMGLDWQSRNRVLQQGPGRMGGVEQMLMRASELAYGTPSYVIDAIINRTGLDEGHEEPRKLAIGAVAAPATAEVQTHQQPSNHRSHRTSQSNILGEGWDEI